MRSTELTREQLDRIEAEVLRQHRYYVSMWKRVQANDIPVDDPLARGVCEAWNGINNLLQRIERLKMQLPELFRPYKKPWRNSGLSAVDEPWATRQIRQAEEFKSAQKPEPPRENEK